MNADRRIRELVSLSLSGNHDVDGVRFIEELLLVAADVGEVKCSLAGDGRLCFQTPGQPACEVTLDRAKSKLRMLCARLSVLCNESDGPTVSLYGGEGIITREGAGFRAAAPDTAPVVLREFGTAPPNSALTTVGAARRSPTGQQRWAVRFTNTPTEQEFIIQAK